MIEHTRDAFEAWWKSSYLPPCDYKYGVVQEGWNAWQAATQAAYQHVQIELDDIASKMCEEMARGKTLGQKYNPVTLGQIQILNDVADAIRQGGDA